MNLPLRGSFFPPGVGCQANHLTPPPYGGWGPYIRARPGCNTPHLSNPRRSEPPELLLCGVWSRAVAVSLPARPPMG